MFQKVILIFKKYNLWGESYFSEFDYFNYV